MNDYIHNREWFEWNEYFDGYLCEINVNDLYSAANRSENSDFVQNSDQMLEMVRKWSEN